MLTDNFYMGRCLELALLGIGSVSPNPMVGAVIVLEGRIVGQGWHRRAGEAHAEVLAIEDALTHIKVKELQQATLFVNLEPCSHWGRTPPCTDMIIKYGFERVVVGCIDPFAKVNGNGINTMREAGIDVTVGVRQRECEQLNCRFFTSQTNHRPYVILKWAETSDGYLDAIRPAKSAVAWMTSEECRTLVHQWRAYEDAIMIGRLTALLDNPALTVRNWRSADDGTPRNPTRVVTDFDLKLPVTLKIFNAQAVTILITSPKNEAAARQKFAKYKTVQIETIPYESTPADDQGRANIMLATLDILHARGIQSLIVEGGAALLNTFINAGVWDEARIFTAQMRVNDLYPSLPFVGGVRAPCITDGACIRQDAKLGLKVLRPNSSILK